MFFLKSNIRRKNDDETFTLFSFNLINDIKEYEVKEILDKKKH